MKPGPGRFVLGHQLSSRPGPEYFLFLSNLNFCFQHPQNPGGMRKSRQRSRILFCFWTWKKPRDGLKFSLLVILGPSPAVNQTGCRWAVPLNCSVGLFLCLFLEICLVYHVKYSVPANNGDLILKLFRRLKDAPWQPPVVKVRKI